MRRDSPGRARLQTPAAGRGVSPGRGPRSWTASATGTTAHPLSDYLRYECGWGYLHNSRVGESIAGDAGADRDEPAGETVAAQPAPLALVVQSRGGKAVALHNPGPT